MSNELQAASRQSMVGPGIKIYDPVKGRYLRPEDSIPEATRAISDAGEQARAARRASDLASRRQSDTNSSGVARRDSANKESRHSDTTRTSGVSAGEPASSPFVDGGQSIAVVSSRTDTDVMNLQVLKRASRIHVPERSPLIDAVDAAEAETAATSGTTSDNVREVAALQSKLVTDLRDSPTRTTGSDKNYQIYNGSKGSLVVERNQGRTRIPIPGARPQDPPPQGCCLIQ